jgi:hypothetical protein
MNNITLPLQYILIDPCQGLNHGPHPGGGKCDRFLKKKPLCQSQGGAGPTSRAKWSLHFVHNLCLVYYYYVIYFQKESLVPRNRPFCHASMNVARVLSIHPKISYFRIYIIQNCVGVVPSPSSRCFSSVHWTRTLYFFPKWPLWPYLSPVAVYLQVPQNISFVVLCSQTYLDR